ncbi:hypothetical protein EB796_004335 [Bugula neritina]|uniref:Uncharacterized protein n=1 Tax=Bugula neritina TaxID=10212 RepID=A0A7J7KGI5_BUGNE|nr:hypothetical protein EB796_004335 [Bugula neritina]
MCAITLSYWTISPLLTFAPLTPTSILIGAFLILFVLQFTARLCVFYRLSVFHVVELFVVYCRTATTQRSVVVGSYLSEILSTLEKHFKSHLFTKQFTLFDILF